MRGQGRRAARLLVWPVLFLQDYKPRTLFLFHSFYGSGARFCSAAKDRVIAALFAGVLDFVVRAFAVPTTVMVLSQPGHMCFEPTVITWMWPFSVLTLCNITDLHLVQTMVMESPVLRASASAGVLICFRTWPPFICSAARVVAGSDAARASARGMPMLPNIRDILIV